MSASAPILERPPHAAPVGAFVGVNVGCGLDAPDGWYNIDNSPTILISRLPGLHKLLRTPAWPRNVHRHNVLKGLPFAQTSVDFIYSSHTFEHFTYAQALSVAKECFRVLKRGGILRVAVPDLGRMVQDYLADTSSMASHRFVDRLLLHHTWQDLLHPGSHHSQMYDCKSLTTLFRDAGFTDPQVCDFVESGIPGILKLELESRRRESLYVEAIKRDPMILMKDEESMKNKTA